ncbi:hypothetical protein CgunFtcFv8_020906 [Champsocephalus gunnari]|uniref:Uncharacterized protein n=1 Tax=Champsocephalus gunnari TaxID=52237 RepID=A0AAN8ED31_CHAGU|nr:hypothetical protein CgunFtcFv8_020906 [Champsocephalus gunnari]
MVSSPLAGRQSASGSPEHILVPTADCPEDISHIIQPNQQLGLTHRPEQRQLEIEYRGDVSQMKLICHSGQTGDKTKHCLHKDTTCASMGAFLKWDRSETRADWWTQTDSARLMSPVAIQLVSELNTGYIHMCLESDLRL